MSQVEHQSGWVTQYVESNATSVTVSHALCGILHAVGVRQSFGIVGGGNAPFAAAIVDSPIELYHMRHEGGASFAATEASLAAGRPTAVFVTTGPGLFNTLTGIMGARWDGAKVVLISGTTSSAVKGRWGVQETSSYTMPADGIFRAGAIFDYAVEIDDAAELPEIARRLQIGFHRPGGFVAHIAVPLSLQTALIAWPAPLPATRLVVGGADDRVVQACAERLDGLQFGVWIGHGARNAGPAIRELVERTGVGLMCTPRAKGVIPEDHPQFVGVTGVGGHDSVLRYLRTCAPQMLLVLGSRLGEASSFWVEDLAPSGGFIHVDLDPDAVGVAYPDVPVLAVQAEIGAFVRQLCSVLPAGKPPAELLPLAPAPRLEPRQGSRVRPQFVMQALQRHVVEAGNALVMSESGNSFAWVNHYLRFPRGDRYRTSALWGSMGQATAGIIGAAVARGGKAVAVVGDGAMLMNNEISTAVTYNSQVVWVVLNDDRYGITHQGMEAWGYTPVETEIPPTSFVQLSRAVGGAGALVEQEAELEAGLRLAMQHDGPFVLEIAIDRAEISPVLKSRIDRLRAVGQEND